MVFDSKFLSLVVFFIILVLVVVNEKECVVWLSKCIFNLFLRWLICFDMIEWFIFLDFVVLVNEFCLIILSNINKWLVVFIVVF